LSAFFRLRDWRVLSLSGLLLLLVISWIFRRPVLTAAGSALVEDDGPAKEQAAVVLGGDYLCTRILKAAALAKAGYVPFVIVSGPQAFGGHESDLTVKYAEEQGYPPSVFRPYPNHFTSTAAEVRGLGDYLRANGIRRIILVTSNYHTHRAARTFREANPGIAVRVIPAPDPSFTPSGWWKDREGRKTFLLEWTKTVAYWIGA
jgi:uncharacterized SAM-binding protein YcdF (DUF218 family)